MLCPQKISYRWVGNIKRAPLLYTVVGFPQRGPPSLAVRRTTLFPNIKGYINLCGRNCGIIPQVGKILNTFVLRYIFWGDFLLTPHKIV